jgi:uncharacterized damage-inducible protein DinB
MSEFDSDKAALLRDLNEARTELGGVVGNLKTGDMERVRRGSWPVSRILQHVVDSERIYSQLISVFNGQPAVSVQKGEITSAEAVASALGVTRAGLLEAISSVEEKDFYRLQTIGHEEYSVLSILENVASHDREHAEQIRKTVAEA